MELRTCIWLREGSDRKWLFPSCVEGVDSVNPSTVIFDWEYCPYCGGAIRLREDDPFMSPPSPVSATCNESIVNKGET